MQLSEAHFRAHDWIRRGFSPGARKRRREIFIRSVGLREGMKVLDLGGVPAAWYEIPFPLDVTLLNLPGSVEQAAPGSHHRFSYVEGDACDVRYPDHAFDVVFSNSVIEHVGGPEKRKAFAREVRRLGRAYWVQTPSIWFPLEVHCGVPFWWFLPSSVRGKLLARWRERRPAWTEMVAGTDIVQLSELRALFPGSALYHERSMGLPKSYAAHTAAPRAPG